MPVRLLMLFRHLSKPVLAFRESAALIADGIHSLSDLLSDLLVIFAVGLGSREADYEHPYGHRRFETLAIVILGISLIAIGSAIAWPG
jgi:divalent metal cation (Fe/Co/Zn/Cd) transporter